MAYAATLPDDGDGVSRFRPWLFAERRVLEERLAIVLRQATYAVGARMCSLPGNRLTFLPN
jgi:hypothetical protein